MEFSLKYPDCTADLLKTFTQSVIEPLYKYALQSKVLYVRSLAVTAAMMENGEHSLILLFVLTLVIYVIDY